jgi:hypothetical protein
MYLYLFGALCTFSNWRNQMTFDSKTDALNVQTNIHIALRLLREGKKRVVNRMVAYIDHNGRIDAYNDAYRSDLAPRNWHRDLQLRFRLHPAVDKLLADHRPLDWQQLVLEYPHQAESDRNRVAYTQNERKGEDNIQTVTSLGKYLTRHFPQLPDHEIRNTVASYSVVGCRVVHTIAEMINVLAHGPHSCMRWNDGHMDIDKHPYKVYDPRLGWGMAVREEGGEIIGRALVYERDDIKCFVRTYQKPSNAGNYSQADDNLNAWLRDQGYDHHSDWEGCYMAYYPYGRHSDKPLAPYLDGSCKDVDIVERDGVKMLLVTEDGQYHFENTDGDCADNEDRNVCADCNDRIDEDDGYWVGADEEEIVCSSCCDHNYYYAYGRRGRQYYVHESNIVTVGDYNYDVDHLDDNSILTLHDGEYAHNDDAVFVESEGEYYAADDDEVCYDDVNERYELRDNCVELHDGSMCLKDDAWMCEHSNDWYSEADVSEKFQTPCGKTVHSDYADEYPADDEDDEVDVVSVTDVTIATEPRIVAVTMPDPALLYEQMRRNRI